MPIPPINMIFEVNKTEYGKISKCSNRQYLVYHSAPKNRFFKSTWTLPIFFNFEFLKMSPG